MDIPVLIGGVFGILLIASGIEIVVGRGRRNG